MRRQYSLYYDDLSLAVRVLRWIDLKGLVHELHSNRCRFWLDTNSPEYTEFALRWADACPEVVESPVYSVGPDFGCNPL